MFGPDRSFADSNAVVVEIRKNAAFVQMVELLRGMSLNIIEVDAEAHDQVTSLVQVTTHAVLATFASVRSQSDIPDELIDAFATPIFRDLDRVSQGMVSENPELYHNIQNANPYGEAARNRLAKALKETLAAFTSSSPEETTRLFKASRR